METRQGRILSSKKHGLSASRQELTKKIPEDKGTHRIYVEPYGGKDETAGSLNATGKSCPVLSYFKRQPTNACLQEHKITIIINIFCSHRYNFPRRNKSALAIPFCYRQSINLVVYRNASYHQKLKRFLDSHAV